MTDIEGIYYTVIDEIRKKAKVGRNVVVNKSNALADESLTFINIKPYVVIESKTYKTERIEANAFPQNHFITDVFIPSTIKVIGAYSFYECSKLKYIRFEEGSKLEVIEYKAFGLLPSCEEIILTSSKLRTIGRCAFGNNNGALKRIVIPYFVKEIQESAFAGIANLADIYFCGSAQFDSLIFKEAFYTKLPANFNIHVTYKYTIGTFGGRNVTESNYHGAYCPRTSICKTYNNKISNYISPLCLVLITCLIK